jgi:protein-S-isoprenylcysteine O-methyltransferase Ste14
MSQSEPSSATPPLGKSEAEQSAMARWGAVLFRQRSWLPVPFVLLALAWPGRVDTWEWIVGDTLLVAGELVRLTGIAAAGTVTRRRSRDVQRLVNYGIFAWVRNPLYVGNFLVWMAFAVVSGALPIVFLAALIFAVEYTFIVAYEEGVLESIFGEEYLAYKRTTPRWIPRPPATPVRGEHDWDEAIRSERSTFTAYIVLMIAFVLKQHLLY